MDKPEGRFGAGETDGCKEKKVCHADLRWHTFLLRGLQGFVRRDGFRREPIRWGHFLILKERTAFPSFVTVTT